MAFIKFSGGGTKDFKYANIGTYTSKNSGTFTINLTDSLSNWNYMFYTFDSQFNGNIFPMTSGMKGPLAFVKISYFKNNPFTAYIGSTSWSTNFNFVVTYVNDTTVTVKKSATSGSTSYYYFYGFK